MDKTQDFSGDPVERMFDLTEEQQYVFFEALLILRERGEKELTREIIAEARKRRAKRNGGHA